jgi:RNA polymerase sigma factor (sigma-70 family)
MNGVQTYASVAPPANFDALVRQHADLVKRIAYHLAGRLPPQVEVDDLVQSGMIGLLEAAQHFTAGRGASFETYAGIRIRGAMLDALRKLDWAPRSVHRKARAAAAAMREVEARKCLPIQELTWLKEVAEARTMLDESIRRLDLASLGAAVRKIERVLAVWPSKMNAKLTENARELTLVSLAKKLQLLCEKSATFKRQLGDKARELEELEQRISDLVATHDDWQSFDDQLRLLDTTLSRSFKRGMPPVPSRLQSVTRQIL